MKKKNINKILSISTMSYILILNATKYNTFVYVFGTIGLLTLIFISLKTKKE